MNTKRLIEQLRSAFLDQDKYQFDKHVPEFTAGSEFLGDCFSQIVVEPKGNKPPRFYHTFSPFDVISKQAPDQALVFENGKLLYNADFTDAVVARTAAMDTLILHALGVTNLMDKNILIIGSGKVAQRSMKYLAEVFGDLKTIACLSRTDDITAMIRTGQECGVSVTTGSLGQISNYDIILCHTNAKDVVLSDEYRSKIKQGAIITTFISSTEHGEIADSFYDSDKANVIIDWQQTLTTAKDLARALHAGTIRETDVVTIKELLGGRKLAKDKRYTVYRSIGTPIQNLAVLQLLVKN